MFRGLLFGCFCDAITCAGARQVMLRLHLDVFAHGNVYSVKGVTFLSLAIEVI